MRAPLKAAREGPHDPAPWRPDVRRVRWAAILFRRVRPSVRSMHVPAGSAAAIFGRFSAARLTWQAF